MILNIDTTKINDANVLGEFLREYCFKEEYGCYSCFDLIDGFKKVDKESSLGQELLKHLGHVPVCSDAYSLDIYKNSYLYSNGEIDVGWHWDGDGFLVIKIGDQVILNNDCKKATYWEWN